MDFTNCKCGGDGRVHLRVLTADGDEQPGEKLLSTKFSARLRQLALVLPNTGDKDSWWLPELSYHEQSRKGGALAVIRLRNLEQREKIAPPVLLSSQASVAETELTYRVKMVNRAIFVNDFLLSRPNFDSENDLLFEHIYKNPNRKIELPEFEEVLGRPLTKNLCDVTRSIGFRGELRKAFFHGISKTALHFVNPVTSTELESRGLGPLRLIPVTKNGEKERKTTKLSRQHLSKPGQWDTNNPIQNEQLPL